MLRNSENYRRTLKNNARKMPVQQAKNGKKIKNVQKQMAENMKKVQVEMEQNQVQKAGIEKDSVQPGKAPEGGPKGGQGELKGLEQDVQYGGRGNRVEIDGSRDGLLTEFGRATLTDRYLLPGE
ncbi:MAG: hypothetical protein ACR2N8_05610, partial [Parvibaculales bacterium]